MVYRVLTENGVIHRLRIYDLDCVYTFDELVARASTKVWDETHGYEDFSWIGAFTITAISFSDDTITYSRNIDHYQFRILKRD